jgi:hypothetical protein
VCRWSSGSGAARRCFGAVPPNFGELLRGGGHKAVEETWGLRTGASEWRGWSRGGLVARRGKSGRGLAVFKGETRAAVGPDEVGWHAHVTWLPPDVSNDLTLVLRAQGAGEATGGLARLQQPVLNFF